MKWSQVFMLMWPLWSICYWCSPDKPLPALVISLGCLLAGIWLLLLEMELDDK